MLNILINSIKPLAKRCGLQSAQPLWEPIALRQYHKKMKSNEIYRQWLEKHVDAWIKSHWAHEQVTDEFVLAHLSSQIYEVTRTLKERMGPVGDIPVLDAGASDGMYLAQVGATQGVGINLLPQCVAKIQSDGFKAVQGSVEQLPFENKSFDYVICCETLEHVPNP